VSTVSELGDAVTWDPTLNLSAYQEVEADSNYATPDAMENYRRMLLQKSAPAALFMKKVAFRQLKLKVLELCSGSSRLLYSMDQLGILSRGYGVEVSESRHRFAQNWKGAIGAENVLNIHRSVQKYGFEHDTLDLVILVDGALSYIYPCDPALPELILRQVHRRVVPGGHIVLELAGLTENQHNALKRDGNFRSWYRGDDKDAFAYALYKTEAVNWPHMVVQNTSIYLPRGGGREKVKREHYKYYGVAELDALFARVDLRPAYYGAFDFTPYTTQSTGLIAVATKE
jgi:SAM-dependent methyltransferase